MSNYAVSKQTKKLVQITCRRTFKHINHKKVRHIEFVTVESLKATTVGYGCLPVLEFKEKYMIIDNDLAATLYGN